MKTCLALLVALSLLRPQTTECSEWETHDGVIIHRVGKGYIYLFPSTQGRIKSTTNPAGVISVGSTITVMYSLKLIGRAKTRFIGMDASRTTGISPQLTVTKAGKAFGFFVRDVNQSTLSIVIEPSFMRKIEHLAQSKFQTAVAREGNLDVTLDEKRKKIVIKEVELD